MLLTILVRWAAGRLLGQSRWPRRRSAGTVGALNGAERLHDPTVTTSTLIRPVRSDGGRSFHSVVETTHGGLRQANQPQQTTDRDIREHRRQIFATLAGHSRKYRYLQP